MFRKQKVVAWFEVVIFAVAMDRTVILNTMLEEAMSDSDDDILAVIREHYIRNPQPNIYRSFADLDSLDGISCYKYFRFEKADIIPVLPLRHSLFVLG